MGDCGMFADKTQIFGGGDKRQKKIVYRAFSENPLEVIQLVVEEPPLPCNEGEVVIKISVRLLDKLNIIELSLRQAFSNLLFLLPTSEGIYCFSNRLYEEKGNLLRHY